MLVAAVVSDAHSQGPLLAPFCFSLLSILALDKTTSTPAAALGRDGGGLMVSSASAKTAHATCSGP